MNKKKGQFYLPSPTESPPASTPARDASPSAPVSSASSSSDDDLPYPAPLPRAPFLSAHFTPQGYLSTLHNRHQTLSDLRAELRARSAALAGELLELVNAEYAAFLGLGEGLRGGAERVEGVTVGVLGFEKGVAAVRQVVRQRAALVEGLLGERARVREAVRLGRACVEVDRRLAELEAEMAAGAESGEESAEEEEDEGEEAVGLVRLERCVRAFVAVRQLARGIGEQHPFLVRQEERFDRLKRTLLLDLGTTLKQARAGTAQDPLLCIVGLYAELDEGAEAVKVLRETRT